jgi:hypothetical protein
MGQPRLSVHRRPAHPDIDGHQDKVGRTGVIFITLFPMQGRAVDQSRPRASEVASLVQPAELRQAKYFTALLVEKRANVRDEIAGRRVALAKHQGSANKRATQHLRQVIGEKRREEFELDCLLEAIQQRFFPRVETPSTSATCFDVELKYVDGWWQIRVPEIGDTIKVRRRDHAEMTAREYIAVSIGTPIREIAVRFISD